MKFLIVFALALAGASAFNVPELKQRSREMPVLDIEGRITNGNVAYAGQFPYQVFLSLQLSTFSTWCGGSLIGHEWVLTAAHCTNGVISVTVYLGSTIRASAETTFTVASNNVIIHSGWDTSSLRNDISLVRIPYVGYTNKISAVPLPSIASSYFTYTGETVVASGWGLTNDASTSVATNLQYVDLQVITNTLCAATYGNSIITPSNICVSTPNGKSTCKGDSGGPLVLKSSGVQVGLTSFGSSWGCRNGDPTAFTRLTSYLDWIKSYTGISY